MKLVVFDLWHLGCVTAACTAAAGVRTVGIDLDSERVAKLAACEPPLYEPGLADLLRQGLDSGKLSFSADIAAVADVDIVWITHDTPVDDDDQADVGLVRREVESLFPHLKDGTVVLVSAQMPVGSVGALERAFAGQANGRKVAFACSPENLRRGAAIGIFQNPGRIIVGVRDQQTRAKLEPLLGKFCDNLIWMSVESAEMVKHGLNAFLAASVTFTNELATICERVGADASEVEQGLRSDPRIGQRAYVRAGPAFAGGTLARDVNYLRQIAHEHNVEAPVMNGILESNRAHGAWTIDQLRRALKPLAGRTVGVLGLAFKAGTSAICRSSSVEIIRALLREGARVQAFDPHVPLLPEDLSVVVLGARACDAAQSADALVVATECAEFRKLSVDEIANAMVGRLVLDPGRFLDPAFASDARLSLISVGRAANQSGR